MAADTHVAHLDLSPGNGTRYRLVLSLHRNRLTVSWPDLNWSAGDFAPHNPPSPEWLVHSGGLKSERDAEVIADAVTTWTANL